MIVVEHGAGSVLDIRGREYCNAIIGELRGKLGSTVGVFKGGNARCDYPLISVTGWLMDAIDIRSPGLSKWGCVSCTGCPNCWSAADTEAYDRRYKELRKRRCRNAGLNTGVVNLAAPLKARRPLLMLVRYYR